MPPELDEVRARNENVRLRRPTRDRLAADMVATIDEIADGAWEAYQEARPTARASEVERLTAGRSPSHHVHLYAMSDAVVAAIVAGVVSLLVTFGKVLWEARQKKQERRLAAREKLTSIASRS